MGLTHSPNIVTDGLVLCLDAANTKSYPGSGTTWTDLSGQSNNGTLVNDVGYSSENSGVLTFDGTNDYINIGSTTDFDFGTGSFTVETWVYINSGNATVVHGQTTNSGTFGFVLYQSGSNSYFFKAGGGSVQFNLPIVSNKWFHIACVRNGSTDFTVYMNGVVEGSSNSFSENITGSAGVQIGAQAGGVGGNLLNGILGAVRMYKGKGFSAAEALQNYNAHKGRYGI